MKKVIIVLTFLTHFVFAQEPDPYNFLPSSVGNVWEYNSKTEILRYEIVNDSILTDGSKFIYYAPNTDPYFRIDTNYNVYWLPVDSTMNWLYYKLNANKGNSWIVTKRFFINEGDTIYIYKPAKVSDEYLTQIFGKTRHVKEITFYAHQQDSVVNEFSFASFTMTLIEGVGEYMEFDDEATGPQKVLRGCIINGDTLGTITSVDNKFEIPVSYELYQNFPNPFNPSTTIKYSISKPEKINIKIYSPIGEEISILVDEYQNSGVHEIKFNANNMPSGIYIYRITAGSYSSSKKMILLK
ncbi:MAG: T9SS type A sorting domain-containing protein [Ignavibacteriales bacterium]|nr:T9SS type A sorting domain-containing protein [Ignavibacteriales bacterium]